LGDIRTSEEGGKVDFCVLLILTDVMNLLQTIITKNQVNTVLFKVPTLFKVPRQG
jgi:hypothetical protein